MTKRSHVDLGMDVPDLLSRMRGSEDASVLHEVTCYQWWNSHEGSATHLDRRFASRRMALLYTAKMNSEELIEVASSMSRVSMSTFQSFQDCLWPVCTGLFRACLVLRRYYVRA